MGKNSDKSKGKGKPSAKKSATGKADAQTADKGPLEKLGKRLDDVPEVKSAARALARAREELDKASANYEQARQSAQQTMHNLSEKSFGELVDSTLKQVEKHPGLGIFVSFGIGWFLASLFRRK